MQKANFLLIFFIFVTAQISAQSDSTFISQTSDSTYQKDFVKYNEEGQIISIEKSYYDSVGFSSYLLEMTKAADIELSESEYATIFVEKREQIAAAKYRDMKKFYKSFSGNDYLTYIDSVKKFTLTGDWKFKVGENKYNVELSKNSNHLTDINSPKKMKIKFIQEGKIKITMLSKNFFDEDLILIQERRGLKYRRKLKDGTNVILRQ